MFWHQSGSGLSVLTSWLSQLQKSPEFPGYWESQQQLFSASTFAEPSMTKLQPGNILTFRCSFWVVSPFWQGHSRFGPPTWQSLAENGLTALPSVQCWGPLSCLSFLEIGFSGHTSRSSGCSLSCWP